MYILVSVSMIGLLLAHRTFSVSAKEFAISKCNQSLFFSLLVLLISILVTSFHSTPLMIWLFIGIISITLKCFPYFLRFFLLKRLVGALIPLLDSVSLGLQTGKSFRLALFSAIENQQGWQRNQLREIYNSISSSESIPSIRCPMIKDLQAELVEIDRSQNRIIDQVRALRRHLKIQENFRRRSGQVTQQIKMQAIIVTGLFAALLIFVIKQFGFVQNKNLIFLSVIIFLIGLIWIFSVGRRMKWKV